MSNRSVQTYTIDSNRNRVKIPTNGNDIRIIISEPSPPRKDVSPRVRFDQKKTTMPTIEIIENSAQTDRESPTGLERNYSNVTSSTERDVFQR